MTDSLLTNPQFANLFSVNNFPGVALQKSNIEVRPWQCYEFKMESEVLDGESFNYLYVPKGSKTHGPKKISSEFFNNELLTCDTTDEEQVIELVQQYGIPFSPFYDSKERFLSGQYSSAKNPVPHNGLATWEERYIEARNLGLMYPPEQQNLTGFFQDQPDDEDPHSWIRRHLIRSELTAFIDRRYLHKKGSEDVLWGCYASELARNNCYARDPQYQKYGGIISIPEIQTTLRLYQLMFPLIAMDQYSRQNPILAEDVVRYFNNKKYVHQNGRFYFFVDTNSDNELANISLKPFEELSQQASTWFEEGSFRSLDNALEAAELCYLTDLKMMLEESLKKASYFFQISSQFVLDQNRNLLSHPSYGQRILKENAKSVFQQVLHSTLYERKIAHNGEAGSLDEAIYSQFIYALKSDAPWKRCKHCGKIFKFYKETDLFTARSIRNSAYCKRSCSTMGGGKKK